MSSSLPTRSLDCFRANALARYHGFARAHVASLPPFARLATPAQKHPDRNTEHWLLLLGVTPASATQLATQTAAA